MSSSAQKTVCKMRSEPRPYSRRAIIPQEREKLSEAAPAEGDART